MTAAAWPRTLLVPADAARQWQALREVLLAVRSTPCASDADLWHSRAADDIAAASAACHRCHALDVCDSYATTAAEATGVWGGVDRNPGSNRSARGSGS